MNNFSSNEIIYIPVTDVRANPYQPRRVFDQLALQELSNSIKEYGVIQPISVRKLKSGAYELVAGERRLRATKIADIEKIPAMIVDIDEEKSAILALIENLQRENLNYFEESEGYANLIVDYNFTQEDVAKKFGKNQSTIANKIRLLKLSDSIRKILTENRLTERHARALLKLPEEKLQLEALKKIVAQGLNVKKTEELINKTIEDIMSNNNTKKKRKIRRYIKDIRLFTNTVEKAVDVMKDSGMNIDYNVQKGEEFYEIKIKIPVN